MGSKKHRQDKAAERRARRQRKSDTNDNFDDFEDDVPKMKIQLERLGLVLKEVEGDGNCLFRALADQLYGSPDRYKRLRQEVPPKLFIILLKILTIIAPLLQNILLIVEMIHTNFQPCFYI